MSVFVNLTLANPSALRVRCHSFGPCALRHTSSFEGERGKGRMDTSLPRIPCYVLENAHSELNAITMLFHERGLMDLVLFASARVQGAGLSILFCFCFWAFIPRLMLPMGLAP